MTKEELLRELSSKVTSGEITREEITSRLAIEKGDSDIISVFSNISLNRALYLLGAAIVLIGIIIFFGQIWEDIGGAGRVLVTLGLGLIMALSGSVLLNKKPEDKIGSVFHAIGGVLIPGGAMVLLSEIYTTTSVSAGTLAFAYGIIFLFYVLLNYIHKRVVLTLFAIANGTAFVYFLLGYVTEGQYYEIVSDLYAYLAMAVGVSYILLANSFRGTWNDPLTRALYFFGSGALYAGAFSQVFGSVIWQLLYFILVLGGVFLSIKLKSRIILITSTIFLIVHVSYITGKYFADSLGWPISLVLLGFVFIGLGYMSVNISKKYIQT